MLSVSAPCLSIIDDGEENGMIDGGKEYTYPAKLRECKDAILRGLAARRTWTLREFAYLLAGFSPQIVDDHLEESEWFQTEVLPHRLALEEALTAAENGEYFFNGYAPANVLRNVGGSSYPTDTPYPVEAYIDFCHKSEYPFPFPLKTQGTDDEKSFSVADEVPVPNPVTPTQGDAEVVDGLTVAALRKVFDHSPALRDIVAAVADWQKPVIGGGELSRRSVNEIQQLKQAVETKAAAGNWGTDNGKLSESYGRVIERLIFGRSGGGRENSSVWYGKRDKQNKTKKKG